MVDERADVVIVGAGAAGLMAAVWAGRAAGPGSSARVVVVDGASKLGAKILVAGGGRCNVTHERVEASDYSGSTTPAIRKVLRRFDVPETVAFFRERGVELKREPTGKLFPTTDRARDVLDALLNAVRDAGVEIRANWRVESIGSADASDEPGFIVRHDARAGGETSALRAQRVVLATGGRSLPKSGSDGSGYGLAHSLGHDITERIFPALAPLVTDKQADGALREISGVSADATLRLVSGAGKRLHELHGSTLCTHFGLSGPAPMNISRFLLDALYDDAGADVAINWAPALTTETADAALRDASRTSAMRALRSELAPQLPERLCRAICDDAGVDPGASLDTIARADRRRLATSLTAMRPRIIDHRGWNYAEATAGGVPLSQLDLKTMESRVTPGLYICGELCDVDGPIGGFNFQWAWASGYVAGAAVGAVGPRGGGL